MLKTRQTLIEAITSYEFSYIDERETTKRFYELLEHPDSFQRFHLPGHITGSAWIVNQDLTKTLLILHGKLKKWLQPGGHADGEEDVLSVALREAWEETGVKKFKGISTEIFDLDIHPIPERKDFPAHLHYDVRFLMVANHEAPITISDESTDLRWVDISDLESLTHNNESIMRMVFKTGNFDLSTLKK